MMMNKIKPRSGIFKKALIVTGVVVAAAILLFFLLDWQSRSGYARVDKEASRIISLVAKSNGVIKAQALAGAYSVGNPYYSRGNGLINTWRYCGFDVNCPESDKGIVALMPRGHEESFLSSLFESSGYKQGDDVKCYQDNNRSTTCFCRRINSQYSVNITVEPADPYHHGAPAQDDGTSTEAWRYITISVSPKH